MATTRLPDPPAQYDRAYVEKLLNQINQQFRDIDTFIRLSEGRFAYSVTDYGAVGDGLTDDTAAIQAALNAWSASDSVATLIFPAAEYKITGPLTVSASISYTKAKKISAYGARLVSTSGSHALKFSVEGTGKLWRGLTLDGLTISGGVDGLIFDGGNPASLEWMYEVTVRDVLVENFTGNGYKCIHGFFESQFYSCTAWADVSNVTGYGFEFDNGVHGTVSSIDLYSLNTRYGQHGLHTTSPVVNVNVYGGTYLSAYEEGIRFALAIGNTINGPHVEDNWTSAIGTVRAGIRISGRNCAVVGVYGTARNASEQNYTLYAFAVDGDIVVSGGQSGGTQTKFGFYDTHATSGSIVSNGVDFDKVSGRNVKSIGTDSGVELGNLKFANVEVVSSTTLDWYLESTFTPTISFGGGTTGITYSSQTGTYTRIGNIVYFYIGIALTAKGSSTGSVLLSELPYAPAATHPVSVWVSPVTSGVGDTHLQGYVNSPAKTVSLHTIAAGSLVTLDEGDFVDASVIRVSGIYRV